MLCSFYVSPHCSIEIFFLLELCTSNYPKCATTTVLNFLKIKITFISILEPISTWFHVRTLKITVSSLSDVTLKCTHKVNAHLNLLSSFSFHLPSTYVTLV